MCCLGHTTVELTGMLRGRRERKKEGECARKGGVREMCEGGVRARCVREVCERGV